MLCSNKIDYKIKTIVYLQQHYYGSDQTLIKSDISNHCPRTTAEIRSRLRSLVSLSPHVSSRSSRDRLEKPQQHLTSVKQNL